MKVITEYFVIVGLNMPRYNEKQMLLITIKAIPIAELSATFPDARVLFNIKYIIPAKLKSTPPAFFNVMGSLSTIAAINIVYMGDMELTMEQSIGVISDIAIKNVI